MGGRPTPAGPDPPARLPLRDSPLRCPRLPSSGGIGPSSRLPSSHSPSRAARFPSSGGIGPASALPRRRRSLRRARLPSSGGIGPSSRLPSSHSSSKLARFPSSGGIGPASALARRFSDVRPERLPSSGGIVPRRPCDTHSPALPVLAAAQVQPGNPAERVRLHPAPRLQRPVAQPVQVVGPVRPVRRRVERGQHRPVPMLYRHRHRGRARDRADRRRDRGRPVAGRRHQSRRADRRDLGAHARPDHRHPGHRPPVSVEHACIQLHGRIRRRERYGGRRDRHAGHAKRLGRRARGIVAAPRRRPRRNHADRH